MRNLIRVWLFLYGGLLLAAFASGDVVYEDYAGAAILASFLAPVAFGSFALWGLAFRRGSILDRRLHRWPTGDYLTIRAMLESWVIFGRIGSGKTSGSLLFLARKALSIKNSSGTIYASNPGDANWWKLRFRESGREGDLKIFSPTSEHRRNVMAELLADGADSFEQTRFLTTIAESQVAKGAKEEPFWRLMVERILFNAIEACMQAYQSVDAPMIAEFIRTACYNADNKNDKWRAKFHYQTMLKATEAEKTSIQKANYAIISAFWSDEFVNMDDKPRTSALASVNNTLHVLNSGLVREIISTTTTAGAEDFSNGIWHLYDFPVSKYGNSAKMLYSALKYATQKHILRNDFKDGDSICFLVADEAQHVTNSGDREALNEFRKHGGVLIFLSQSISNFKIAMGSEDEANAFIGQFGHKVFHAVDPVSADFACKLVGEVETAKQEGSTSMADDINERLEGKSRTTYNFGLERKPLMLARQFMTGLRNGGPANKFKVDGWLIRSEEFRDGSNATFITLDQR